MKFDYKKMHENKIKVTIEMSEAELYGLDADNDSDTTTYIEKRVIEAYKNQEPNVRS